MSDASRSLARFFVPDQPKFLRNIQLGVGDGVRVIFRIPRIPVNELVAGTPDITIRTFNPDTSVWGTATIALYDATSGDVTLDAAPAVSIVVTADFSIVTFSNDNIDTLLARNEIADCPYLCAAMLVRIIMADRTRMISFTQGDTKYVYKDKIAALLVYANQLETNSPLTGASISVPFYVDFLSRIGYTPSPLIQGPDNPFGKF